MPGKELRAKSKENEDEFASLLDLAKEDKADHNLQRTPSLRVVLYLDEQVDDILRVLPSRLCQYFVDRQLLMLVTST